MERDLTKRPYSADEQRVADYFFEAGVGGGADPIGYLLTAHQYAMRVIVAELREDKERLSERIATLFAAIEHGDAEHRRWLKDKLTAHFAGDAALGITPRAEDTRREGWRAESYHIMGHFRQRGGHRRNAEGYCIDCIAMMTAAQERAYCAGRWSSQEGERLSAEITSENRHEET